MDRLTKIKEKKYSRVVREMNKDLTFTPKINKKSKILDKKRNGNRSVKRYNRLHEVVSNS